MNKLLFLAIVLLTAGCKEKFISPAPAVVTGYLVIEGVVNNGGGPTNIRLSRTSKLTDTAKKNETGALVQLEDNRNNKISFSETGKGNYSVANLQLDTSLRFRLNIKTANNEIYQSDFVSINNNPPIDSVNWIQDNNGVQLYVNTNDPTNSTRYYQWEYNETWEIHSGYYAILKWATKIGPNNTQLATVAYRDSNDAQIFTCYQFNASSNIIAGSSARLAQDIIHLPLTQIPANTRRISALYSILVRQYSWSKQGYEFLDRMKKNTETVGSIFDPQPSELNSNFRCISNQLQPVIGFLNICTIREKRIFIKNKDLLNWDYRAPCTDQIIPNISDSIKQKAIGTLPIVPVVEDPFGNIVTFNIASPLCVDCRLSGTNVKPPYWP